MSKEEIKEHIQELMRQAAVERMKLISELGKAQEDKEDVSVAHKLEIEIEYQYGLEHGLRAAHRSLKAL